MAPGDLARVARNPGACSPTHWCGGLHGTRAPTGLARPNHRAAAHRLHHSPLRIKQLEIDEPIRRHGEVCAAVVRYLCGTEYPLVVEVVPGHARRLLARSSVPGWPGPESLFRRLDDPQPLDRPPLDLLHPCAAVDVGNIEMALGFGEIDPRRNHRRPSPSRQRHRVEAARAFHVKQDLVARRVDQVDSHLLGMPCHPGAKKVLVGEWIGVFVLELHASKSIEVALPTRSIAPAGQVRTTGCFRSSPRRRSTIASAPQGRS